MKFVRAASELDNVRLLGLVHTPPKGPELNRYADVVRMTNPLDKQDIFDGISLLKKRHGHIDRIICILEALMVPVAEARAKFGVPGTQPKVAHVFRDKNAMKNALTEAGLPVARHRLLSSFSEGEEFAELVGYPLILKPPAGMGSKSTFRVSEPEALKRALAGMHINSQNPILAEEMLQGREFSFETITLGGQPQVASITHYLPSCLEVLENPWMQYCVMLPRDISGPQYQPIKDIGVKAIQALGLQNGMTHMEWFQRSDGTFVIGEIAQRPAGANITPMNAVAHGIDIWRAWARAEVDGELDSPWDRKFAVGTAFLRGMGRGRVVGVTGWREVQDRIGHLIVEAKLPTMGAHKSGHYEGDGRIMVKHPETEAVKKALGIIVQTLKVHYSG
jgi:hypothetical protein